MTIKGVRGQAGIGSFVNPVLAGLLLGAVRPGAIALDHQRRPFGVAADRIGSIQGASFDGGSLALRNPDDPAALADFLAANDVDLGELRLDVVPAALRGPRRSERPTCHTGSGTMNAAAARPLPDWAGHAVLHLRPSWLRCRSERR